MSHSGTNVSGGVEHGNKWFRYRAPAYILLLTAISIILVILGVLIQSPYPDSCSGILYEVPCRLYNIARVMVFDVNPSEEFPGNWVLSLGLLCVAVTAGFMGLTLWFRVFTKVKLSRLKDHIVVCGLETVVGRQIAINYRKNNQTVVAVDQDIYSGEKKHYIDRLRDEGVLIVDGDQTSERVLKEVAAHKASAVYAADDIDLINVEVALAVKKFNQENSEKPKRLFRKKRDTIRCRVHIDKPLQSTALSEAMNSLFEDFCKSFSQYQMTARDLMRRVAQRENIDPDKGFQVILIGFQDMGQLIAQEIAMQGHVSDKYRTEILICDEDIEHSRDTFLSAFPRFCPELGCVNLSDWSVDKDRWDAFNESIRPPELFCGEHSGSEAGIEYACSTEFLSMGYREDSEHFIHQLKRSMREDIHTVIVVSTDEERLNADIALRLEKKLGEQCPNIYPWIPESNALTEVLRKAMGQKIIPCGESKEILLPELIDQPEIEPLAKQLHDNYRQRSIDNKEDYIPETWEELSEEFKNSNRERAQSFYIKVYALGLGVCPADKLPQGATIIEEFTAEQRQLLMHMEHNRWCAEKLMSGWSWGKVRDNQEKRHNLLIPFKPLDDKEKEKDSCVADEILDAFNGKSGNKGLHQMTH